MSVRAYSRIGSSMTRWMKTFDFHPGSIPFALLILCVITYGLQISGMGFYWDDWPWLWISHVYGSEGMLSIDSAFRPLTGLILWFGSALVGNQPLGWQIINLVYRWFTALALWWTLGKIWPNQVRQSAWVAFLFLVYPGFTQQFITLNSSRHILPLAFFFCSLGFMVWAIREKKRYWSFTLFSIFLALITMLSTEYYYGLELIRPLVTFLVVDSKDLRERLRQTARYWLPFLVLLLIIFAWRFAISNDVNYPVTITRSLSGDLFGTLVNSASNIRQYFITATVLSWLKSLSVAFGTNYGLRVTALYWTIVILVALVSFIYFSNLRDDKAKTDFWKQAIALGVFSTLLAGLPFVATSIPVALEFPADRTLLPFMFGACLLIVGVVDGIFRKLEPKVILISLLVGFAVGYHTLVAVSYRIDWESQRSFFQQLIVRVPSLEPNTTLLYEYSIRMQNFRSTDNSLAAPLNWIYAPNLASDRMPYSIIDLRLRENKIPIMEAGHPISDRYGDFKFTGSTDKVLVIHYAPSACLRILHPHYDMHKRGLSENVEGALSLSNLDLIDPTPSRLAEVPREIFGLNAEPDWCTYFQKADLARQLGDWEEVVKIGEHAIPQFENSIKETELFPFIQAYAHTDQWEQAVELTHLAKNEFVTPWLCSIWLDLANNTPNTQEKQLALDHIEGLLDCASFQD